MKNLIKKYYKIITKNTDIKMEKFKGKAEVTATPINLGDYNNYKGWTIPANEDPTKEGYLVKYENGFETFMPKDVFELSFVVESTPTPNIVNITPTTIRTLENTTASQAKDNIKDIKFWGNGDAWKLLGKASSVNEGWMKSSKAYQIDGVGCIVQVTTQQFNEVAEAVVFVPNTVIEETKGEDGVVISRKIIEHNFARAK